MKLSLWLTAIVFHAVIMVQAQTNLVMPADEMALQSLIINFNNSFNAHDTKKFAAAFSEDADYTNWMGVSAHGRIQIEVFHIPVLTVMYKNAVQKVTASTIRFIKPDVAEIDVRVEVVGGKTPDGNDAPLLKFMLNWTATKERGQWLIKVMHNARLPDMNNDIPGKK